MRAVADVFVPCAITAAPGAVGDRPSSSFQRPERKKPVSGRWPSTDQPAGTDVNQVGGSTIARSSPGYAPVIWPVSLAVLRHLMIPLQPRTWRITALSPATWPIPGDGEAVVGPT